MQNLARWMAMYCRAVVGLFVVVMLLATHAEAAEVVLADQGKARLAIVVGESADDRTRAAAGDLAEYLKRITGATFDVKQGDGASGLVVGVPDDFTAVPFSQTFDDHPFSRERYRLRSTVNGLYLLGASPQAAEFAVWDVLHRFGYRYFFPTETWEVVPHHQRLAIDVDVEETPSYFNRSGPRGAMRQNNRTWAVDGWQKWRVRNRTAQAFALHTGHAYDALVRRHQAAFDANPQYFAKVKGKREFRRGAKLCIGNADLRKLVVQDAINYFEANPDADTMSLDPSDGSGWCGDDCELCAPLGSVTDRVVLLCNEVAGALDEAFERQCFIGVYAYNDYSPPPSIEVHPNVIVSLATAFIRGGYTFDEMLEQWSAKAKYIGIREYYAVAAWNSSLPGNARAGRVGYIQRTIPKFYEDGARFMNAEADGAWGANGLGYYLATRLLWDVTDADRTDAIIDDFLQSAFGKAKAPMGEFYELMTGSSKPRLSDHLVGRMYRLIEQAKAATDDEQETARINDLLLYTRHVELNRVYAATRGDQRYAAIGQLMAHAWRIRETQMADTLGVLSYLNRTVRKKDNGLTWGEGYTAVRPPDSMRVDEDKPFSDDELAKLLREGIANNPTLAFEPIDFGDYLIPAKGVHVGDVKPIGRQTRTRGTAHYYTWLTPQTQSITLSVTTGTIYDNRGSATITLEQWDEDDHDFLPVTSGEVPPDKQSHDVTLRAKSAGLHRVVVSEQMTGTTVVWPYILPQVTPHGLDHSNHTHGRDTWYFYVPRGTRVIGAYVSASSGYIANPAGEEVMSFEDKNLKDYISIPVPAGQDGKLWSVHRMSGSVGFMTVPPFGFNEPSLMLLPEDVVRADRR